jgi:hypothetical protein
MSSSQSRILTLLFRNIGVVRPGDIILGSRYPSVARSIAPQSINQAVQLLANAKGGTRNLLAAGCDGGRLCPGGHNRKLSPLPTRKSYFFPAASAGAAMTNDPASLTRSYDRTEFKRVEERYFPIVFSPPLMFECEIVIPMMPFHAVKTFRIHFGNVDRSTRRFARH